MVKGKITAGFLEAHVTKHAEQRWVERFPQHNLAGQYSSAKPVNNKLKRRIEAVVHREIVGKKYRGIHFLRAPCGAIFVCGPRHFIVTVYPEPPK